MAAAPKAAEPALADRIQAARSDLRAIHARLGRVAASLEADLPFLHPDFVASLGAGLAQADIYAARGAILRALGELDTCAPSS